MQLTPRHAIRICLCLVSIFPLTDSVAVAMSSASIALPEAEYPVARQHWSAQWISHPTAPLREPITLHFKKAFEVKDVPAHFIVHVSGDNRFVIYVNGQRVGDGPARGDLAHWRYETFDLAPTLKVGANLIAATVWNFGIYAPVAQFSDRTAFLVEGDTAAEAVVNTDASWLVEEEPGQRALPRTANGFWAYEAVGATEVMHAAQYDWNWATQNSASAHGMHGSGWVHAGPALRESIYADASVAAARGVKADIAWALIPDTLPHMSYEKEDSGHVVRSEFAGASAFPRRPISIAAHSKVHILLDRSELTTAYPKLWFSGGKGSRIVITYAEALYDEQQHKGDRNEVGTRQALGLQDEIYPDGGRQRYFEPLWWRTWRYLDLEVTTAGKPLRLDGLETYFTAYPFNVGAQFHSSDHELDKIWKIGWHTAQLDAHETYMDTPYYEQLQYAGDTRIQAMITYAMTGDDRLPRQAIRALNDSRIPEGITASRYPSALPQYIPPFSLLWIGMVHDYSMYRPDTQFVKEVLPGTRSVLDWFDGYQDADGLLGKLPWWSFIDWVEGQEDFPTYSDQGESCLVTLEYIGALTEAVDMERLLGNSSVAGVDETRQAKAKQGVMSQCWDTPRGLVADSAKKDKFSQQANMLAVLYDVVPRAEQREVMRRIIATEPGGANHPGMPELIQASYYFRYYLARALDHAGMADEYLKTLGSWREFLKMGFTTWPEQPGNPRSDCHAWSAHPTFDLLTLVAGVGPGEPGFKTVRIAPHLGNLTELEVSYPHDKGLIHVSYSVSGGVTHAEVDLPAGLTGELVWKDVAMPLRDGKTSFDLK